MQPTVSPRQMQSIFDVHQYDLSEAERGRLEDSLDALTRMVDNFPVADLHIMIEGNARSNDVSVKLTLILPGNTLVTNDRDSVLTDVPTPELIRLARALPTIDRQQIVTRGFDATMVADSHTYMGADVLLPKWTAIRAVTQELFGGPQRVRSPAGGPPDRRS